MSTTDLMNAALDQKPIEFKEAFDALAQEEIIKQGEAIRASILSSFSKLAEAKDEDEGDKKDEPKDDEDEPKDDEDEDEELEEQTIEINALDPKATVKKLTAAGIRASTDPKDADGVVVQIKDKASAKKLKSWMLDNGWDQVDLEDAYPEILKAAK